MVETFTYHFSRQTATKDEGVGDAIDDGVGEGVTREAFALFWDVATGRMFQMEDGDL